MKVVNTRLLGVLLVCHAAAAQIITTVAGTGYSFPAGGPTAVNAPLGPANSVAVDPAGNVFVVDTEDNLVLRISVTGTLNVVAGNGIPGFSGDGGPATSASLSGPYGVAVDAAGNLYISDSNNNRIRKVSYGATTTGVITTVVGNGNTGFSGDGGQATSAELNVPNGVGVDSSGNLYIADTFNNRIRKVSGGIITTVVGNGTCCFSGDGGPATSAAVSQPVAVAVDSAGNLYVDTYNRIRKVSYATSTTGLITSVAGNGIAGFSGDGGPATSASLNTPAGVTVDPAGNLYIADSENYRIRKVSSGMITTLAGNGNYRFSGDGGPATSASLNFPEGVTVDSAAGNLYIADTYNNRIRKLSGGTITTVAGNGNTGFSGDGGSATSASLSHPQGVAIDSAHNLYIADYTNNRVRKLSGGTITTVAGNGAFQFSGDGGPAPSASIAQPGGVAVDSAGNLYIADTYNSRIRKVSNGTITPFERSLAADASRAHG
jgi:trimeric autotransporter adhesin